MKLRETSVPRARFNGGTDEADRIENDFRHQVMVLPNAATQRECLLGEVVTNELPRRSTLPIPMLNETSWRNDELTVDRKSARHQEAGARARSRRVQIIYAIADRRELTGTTAHERARLTFVRRVMQMPGNSTKRGRFLSKWLLHQKTREHCGGCFVEPLFEKGVNFLFQIGRMVQSRKFKGLECRDSGLLKILPWRADTSGTHLEGLLGLVGERQIYTVPSIHMSTSDFMPVENTAVR
jgi:hypothetical protein